MKVSTGKGKKAKERDQEKWQPVGREKVLGEGLSIGRAEEQRSGKWERMRTKILEWGLYHYTPLHSQ